MVNNVKIISRKFQKTIDKKWKKQYNEIIIEKEEFNMEKFEAKETNINQVLREELEEICTVKCMSCDVN